MHSGEGKEHQRVFRALPNRLGRKSEALRMCSTDHSPDRPGLWREGKEGAELVEGRTGTLGPDPGTGRALVRKRKSALGCHGLGSGFKFCFWFCWWIHFPFKCLCAASAMGVTTLLKG